MAEHIKKPIVPLKQHGRIGMAPSSNSLGAKLYEQYMYLSQWTKNQVLYSYSGPPDDDINDYYGTGNNGYFYVILHGPARTDASTARLGGVLLPWNYKSVWGGSSYDQPVKVMWFAPGDSYYNIWGSDTNYIESSGEIDYIDDGNPIRTPKPIELFHDDFVWTPDGSWQFGVIETFGIQTASLCIWAAPDAPPTDTQALFKRSHFNSGQSITGFEDFAEVPSLGTMIHMMGDGAVTAGYDSLQNNTKRCILQSGHPFGIWTDSTEYVDIANGGTFKVFPQNLTDGTTDVASYPALVVKTNSCDADNKAYVKLTSTNGADTWELEISGNSEAALYDYTDASNDTLTIDPDEDEIKIELKGAGTSEITLRTFSLWQDAPWGAM